MVTSISGAGLGILTSTVGTGTTSATGGGFDAALAAAQKAAAQKAAQDAEMRTIRDKGFTAYARDTLAENLRQKMRQQALAAMGLDENSLAKLPPTVKNEIEQRIEAAIKLALEQTVGNTAAAKKGESGGSSDSAKTDQRPATAAAAKAADPTPPATVDAFGLTGQTLPGGKKSSGTICPVIPVLAWPGGPSLIG